MKSPRSLTDAQTARVRQYLWDMMNELDTQVAVANEIGISQQVVGAILKGDKNCGPYVADKVAAYYGIPAAAIVNGAPVHLVHLLRENRGRWSDPTIAAIVKMAEKHSMSAAEWENQLDAIEKALVHVAHTKPKKK